MMRSSCCVLNVKQKYCHIISSFHICTISTNDDLPQNSHKINTIHNLHEIRHFKYHQKTKHIRVHSRRRRQRRRGFHRQPRTSLHYPFPRQARLRINRFNKLLHPPGMHSESRCNVHGAIQSFGGDDFSFDGHSALKK